MAVYCDDMYLYPMGQFQRGPYTYKMSHMIADTDEELHEMARKIGVEREHFQKEGTYKRHYDIAMSKRALAIKNGAISIRMSELGFLIRNRKETGQLGSLEEMK